MFISLSLICLKDTKSQSQQLYSEPWGYGNICCSRVRSFFGNSYISDHLGIVMCSLRDIYVSSTDSLYVPEWFNSKPTYWWIVIIKDGLWSLYFVLLGSIFHYVLCLLHSSLWKQPPRRLWNKPASVFNTKKPKDLAWIRWNRSYSIAYYSLWLLARGYILYNEFMGR